MVVAAGAPDPGRGRDWTLLGGDPTPGVAAGVSDVVDVLRAAQGTAAELSAGASDLGMAAGTSGWSGLAADGFLAALTPVPAGILDAADRAGRAAAAAAGWAGTLVLLQSRAGLLLDRAEDVDQQLRAAQEQLSGAVVEVERARAVLRAVRADPDAEPAVTQGARTQLDHAAVAVSHLQQQIDELAEELERLRVQAAQLAAVHGDAAAAAAATVTGLLPDPWALPPFALRADGGGIISGLVGITLDTDGDGRVSPAELVAGWVGVLEGDALTGDERLAAVGFLSHLLAETARDPVAARALVDELVAQDAEDVLLELTAYGTPLSPGRFIGPVHPTTLAVRDALLGPLLDVVAAAGTADGWRFATLLLAGIDGDDWDPSRGLAPLDGVAVAAWTFYADLFAADPDRFLWAGMATLAGGTFYAAFQDIHVLRVGLESGAIPVEEAARWLAPGGPISAWLAGELADLGAAELAQELRYVETTFLSMQQEIFSDLAWQHVAYATGGLAAMQALEAAGEITPLHLAAWTDIDSGLPLRVEDGNRRLLQHEQMTIIADDYDAIRDHSPVTWALTMGMSLIGHSPIPGGEPFRDVVHADIGVHLDTPDRVTIYPDRVFGIDIPGPSVSVDTPDRVGATVELPVHNVSIAEHRWDWIERDMLPAWIDHVHAGTAADLVAVPIPAQADDQRIIPDVGPTRYDPGR